MARNILILGASYGSLLATKLLMAGHNVTVVCRRATADLINRDGTEVRIKLRDEAEHRAIFSRDLPGQVDAAPPQDIDLSRYDMRIKSAVLSYRAESLSPLPAFWYTMVDAPKHRSPKNRDSTASSGRSTSTSGTRTSATGQREMNPYADTYLMARFRDSGHTAISAMIQGKDVTIPKHAGSHCCLSWAYKGACSDVCKRKGAHKKYSRATIQELHKVLDDCGVPNPQP